MIENYTRTIDAQAIRFLPDGSNKDEIMEFLKDSTPTFDDATIDEGGCYNDQTGVYESNIYVRDTGDELFYGDWVVKIGEGSYAEVSMYTDDKFNEIFTKAKD